jgi:hypothetical protein
MRFLKGDIGRQSGKLRHQSQEGHCRHVGNERIRFGHVADARPDFALLVVAVEAQNVRASGNRLMESQQGQDQGRFAGAVRAEQPDGFPDTGCAKTAGDATKNLPPSEFYLEILEFDYIRWHE